MPVAEALTQDFNLAFFQLAPYEFRRQISSSDPSGHTAQYGVGLNSLQRAPLFLGNNTPFPRRHLLHGSGRGGVPRGLWPAPGILYICYLIVGARLARWPVATWAPRGGSFIRPRAGPGVGDQGFSSARGRDQGGAAARRPNRGPSSWDFHRSGRLGEP